MDLKEDALSVEWFKQTNQLWSDMEQLFTYTKICHSRRIYGKMNRKKYR